MGMATEHLTEWRTLNDCLNLGAGNRPVGHAVNVDVRAHSPHINFLCNLNHLPWPWVDNSFDHILAFAVLEHLDIDLLTAMNEMWRIIRHKGLLEIKLPYWRSAVSYDDPSHRYAVNVNVFNTFDPTTKRGQTHGFYTDRKWKIISSGFNPKRTCVIARLLALKDEIEDGNRQGK